MTSALYTRDFYAANVEPSRQAAEIILPIVWELAGPFESVADVGCGTGCWLDVAKGLGAEWVHGWDGEYAREHLVISEKNFIGCDLDELVTMDRSGLARSPFDLVMCLETAEHLEPESADGLIKFLTDMSDVVLFSAAIPGQGGTNHINEQWTAYWVKLFRDRDYLVADPIRSRIWDDERTPVWYRQNIFLACRNSSSAPDLEYDGAMTIVHPELYMRRSGFFR